MARSSFPMGRARDLTPYVYPLIFPLWFGKGPWDRLPHRCWPENSSLTGSGYSARSEGIKSGFGDLVEMTPFWARGFLLNTVKHTSVFPPRPWRLLSYFLSPWTGLCWVFDARGIVAYLFFCDRHVPASCFQGSSVLQGSALCTAERYSVVWTAQFHSLVHLSVETWVVASFGLL